MLESKELLLCRSVPSVSSRCDTCGRRAWLPAILEGRRGVMLLLLVLLNRGTGGRVELRGACWRGAIVDEGADLAKN